MTIDFGHIALAVIFALALSTAWYFVGYRDGRADEKRGRD